jgi:hypothetical protein
MLRVTRAFVPLLKRSHGAIVNNMSLTALAPLPIIPAYSSYVLDPEIVEGAIADALTELRPSNDIMER